MADRETAMREGDAEQVLARLAPQAVRFGLAPTLAVRGSQARDASGMQDWFATFDGRIDFEISELQVSAGPDVAFCHSLNRLTATPQGSPASFTLWSRATVGLCKLDGTWQITREHDSTPFYMDGSFRAAVDLQPGH